MEQQATLIEKTIEIYADTKGWGTCSGCKERILWGELVKGGKKMCFDAPAVPRMTRHDEAHRLIEIHAFSTNHWASCPNADRFAAKKRAVAR